MSITVPLEGFGGGSNPLNFKVVGGTSAPSSPKENTIWVNTDTEITSWDFSATEPYLRSKNKNFNCYPYYHTTMTQGGITYTDNGDGSITVKGTATEANGFRFSVQQGNMFFLPKGTYILSGSPGVSGFTLDLYIYDANGNPQPQINTSHDNGKQIVFTQESDGYGRLAIWVGKGASTSGITFYPQIEKGSSATPFVKGDATGQVWFTTGTASNAEFNALKKNGIQVYPLSAKQYVGGAWVDKTAKIYKGGLWTDWATYLYNDGDECTDITGGWSFLNPVEDGYTLGSGVKADGEIQLSATNYTAVSACPSRKIDLTNYSQLIVNVTDISFTGGGAVQLAVSDTTKLVTDHVAELRLPLSVGEHTLDVSYLTGYYYIGVSVWSWVDTAQRVSFKIVKMR